MNSRGPASGNMRRHRGAAMVEFAIVLPLLLVTFFGLVETGRALILQHQLLRQTEAAARYLGRAYQGLNADCTNGPNWSSASDVAATLLVYGSEAAGSTPLIADMESDDVDTAAEQRTVPGFGNACVVTVTASVAYPSIFGDSIPLLGIAQPTLQARSEERYVGE